MQNLSVVLSNLTVNAPSLPTEKEMFFQLNNILFLQFWFWPDCHPRECGFGVQLSLWQWLSEVSFILCLHGVQDGRLNCVWAPLWQVWSCQDNDGCCNLCDNLWCCHLFCSKYAGFHHFAWLYRICSHRIVFMWVSTSTVGLHKNATI